MNGSSESQFFQFFLPSCSVPFALCAMFDHLLGWYTIYTFLGVFAPLMEFCQVENSLCVQVWCAPILSALLNGTRAVSVSQTLWRGIFTWQGSHPVRHWAVELSSFLTYLLRYLYFPLRIDSLLFQARDHKRQPNMGFFSRFLATVCKTVHPTLSDVVCVSVLSFLSVCDVVVL